MAVSLYFRRITGPTSTDQDLRVTYAYGPDPSDTPHRLVIDLVDDEVGAVDGTPGEPDMRVVSTVMRLRRETGEWPATGSRFS